MPRILKTEEEKKETKRKNYLNRKSPDYIKRPLLTLEEKKMKKSEYNKRPDVTKKREDKNNEKYFCVGCQRKYCYTHKKDHFTGCMHIHIMKTLKEKNIDHIEQHLHEKSSKILDKKKY